MLSIPKAIARIASVLPPPGRKMRAVKDSLSWYSAAEVRAPGDIPPSPCAAQDGFLVRNDAQSGTFTVGGLVVPRHCGVALPPPGYAFRIEAGASVVSQAKVIPSDCACLVGTKKVFLNTAQPAPVLPHGALLRKGDIVLEAGSRVSSRHILLLRLAGVHSIDVLDLPAVEVLAVDSEVARGRLPEATATFLVSFLAELGIPAVFGGVLPDQQQAISKEVVERLPGSLLLLCGGSGCGATDQTVLALRQEGIRLLCEGVAIQPGGTACIAAGKKGICLVVPGDSRAALAVALGVVKPSAARWLGVRLGDWTARRSEVLAAPWKGPPELFVVAAGVRGEGGIAVAGDQNLLKAPLLLGLPAGRAVRRSCVVLRESPEAP